MILAIILIGLIVTLILVFLIGNNNERYWKKRGVKFHTKNKVTGVFWNFLTQKGALFEHFGMLYNEYKNEPAVGIGSVVTPALFVIHPKNVQHVLQGDFNAFNHRGIEGVEGDTLAENLLFLNGSKWKVVRQNMSPLFTANKLKSMFYIIDKCAQDLVIYLKDNSQKWEGGCFDTLMTYCNAAVCGSIFGINSESIFDSPFLQVAKDITAPSFKNNFRFAMMNLSPKICRIFGIKFFKEHEEFLIDAITKVIQQREKENVKKHDFADICVHIQKNGVMKDSATGYQVEPSYGLLTAQAVFFLIAGVEPVAIAIFATLMELGRNPEILAKVHQEIDEQFEKHEGKITYDVISEMKYLHKILSEALRKNPPIGTISRQCVRDTVLPVGNIKVEKGTKTFSPVYHIHNDPRVYPSPEIFDPERFAKDSKQREEFYMPFGMGNRMCIGARYAKLQMAAGVVHVLRHFTVKTKELGPPQYKHHFIQVRPLNVDVQFIPRNVK
ncbi:cytochrome P450 6k1-like [Anticarsia gemmatalis]|uniref:cytochrome P450 6k1-like n=1 Tax=Anticarsia gemmatalis TaxID=129554 RepID=UPI003F758CD9